MRLHASVQMYRQLRMQFQTPLSPARLVRRYKRFLADMVLEGDGTAVTAHCPNPGAMTGLADPGARCWVERSDDPRRKLAHAWRLVELAAGAMACVDTALANRVVAEGLRAGAVPALAGLTGLRAEVVCGPGWRVDFMADPGDGGPKTLIEVKSVTLARDGWAEFPDTVTQRGTRHLRALAEAARGGQRAVMLYVVNRTDVARLRIAADIDPAYARAFDAARAAGVAMLAHGCMISTTELRLGPPVAVDTTPQAR